MSELSPDSLAILEAGRDGDEPSEADRARLRSSILRVVGAGALGLAGVAGAKALAGQAGAVGGASGLGAAGGAAAAAATKGALVAKGAALATAGTGAVLTGKLVAVVALVGVIGGGIAIGSSVSDAPSRPAAVEAPVRGPKERVNEGSSEKKSGEAAVDAPGAGSEPGADPPGASPGEEPLLKVDPRGAAGSPEAKAESGAGSLEAETKRLREAHAALQAGDPEAALSMLEKGSDEGELREERTAARFLTLCKLGRTAEAAELAASFIRESPQSPLVDRVRAGCPTSRAPGKPAGGAAAPAPIHDSPPPDPAPAPPFDIND